MQTLLKRRALAAAAAIAIACTASACEDDTGTSGGTSGGTVAAVQASITPANCYPHESNHRLRVEVSGLAAGFRFNVYLYHPALVDDKDPKNVFRTFHGTANNAGRGSYSFSCQKRYPGGSYAALVEEASSGRRSEKIFFNVH